MESDPLPRRDAEQRRNLSLSELDRQLVANGYVRVDGQPVAYYFPKTLWQQETMDRVVANYDQINSALRPDHTIDLSKDPDLQDLVLGRMSGMGLRPDDGTQFGIVVQRTLTLQAGDKSMNFDVPGNGAPQKISQGRPSIPLGATDARDKGRKSPLDLTFPGSEVFYAYGEIAGDRSRMAKAYEYATGLLGGHWSRFWSRRRAKAQKLLNDVSGFDPTAFMGMTYDLLPQSLKSEMLTWATGPNGPIAGMSPSAGQAWLSQFSLSGSAARADLVFPSSTPNHMIEFSLP